MADNDKKGPRDISDLKARLGLKKQPGGAPVPGPAITPPPGVPTPVPAAAQSPAANLPPALSGVPAPGAVPPPPGFTPPPGFAAPAPAPAPPPDPRRDPFAAQQAAAAANLAAFYGVGQAIPGDANAVQGDAIKKPKPWPLIGGGVAIGLVALGLGYFSGNISVSRSDYNVTTEQAAKIRDEVDKIQKQVKDVAQLFASQADKSTGGINFGNVEKLKELDIKEPDVTARLFKTNYASFEPSTVQQLFTYYNDVIVLAKQVQRHATLTLNDKDAIDKAIKSRSGAKDATAPGVIVDLTQQIPSATLIEITGFACPKAGDNSCGPTERKVLYRTAMGAAPQQRPIKGKPGEIAIGFSPTDLLEKKMSGDTNALALEAYGRRNKEIVETLGRLAETEKQLIGNLKKRAESPRLWTLF